MLIIDINKDCTLQYPDSFRDLKEHFNFLIADGFPNVSHELQRILDVLQGHLADNEVSLHVNVLVRIEIRNEFHFVN